MIYGNKIKHFLNENTGVFVVIIEAMTVFWNGKQHAPNLIISLFNHEVNINLLQSDL